MTRVALENSSSIPQPIDDPDWLQGTLKFSILFSVDLISDVSTVSHIKHAILIELFQKERQGDSNLRPSDFYYINNLRLGRQKRE